MIHTKNNNVKFPCPVMVFSIIINHEKNTFGLISRFIYK